MSGGPGASPESVAKVARLCFGHQSAQDGFSLLVNGPGWGGDLRQDAKTLATLPSSAPMTSGERFWSGFHGWSIALRYESIPGVRAGSFNVDLHAAPAASRPFSSEALIHGQAAPVDRAVQLQQLAALKPETVEMFLGELLRAVCGGVGKLRITSWKSLAQYVDAASSLIPPKFLERVDFVSHPVLAPLNKTVGQFVLDAYSKPTGTPNWVLNLIGRLVPAVRQKPEELCRCLEYFERAPSFRSIESFAVLVRAWIDQPVGAAETAEYIAEVLALPDTPNQIKLDHCRRVAEGLFGEGEEKLLSLVARIHAMWRKPSAAMEVAERLFHMMAERMESFTLVPGCAVPLLEQIRDITATRTGGEGCNELLEVMREITDRSEQLLEDDHQFEAAADLLDKASPQRRELPRLHRQLIARLWHLYARSDKAERRDLLKLRHGLAEQRSDVDEGLRDLKACLRLPSGMKNDAFLAASKRCCLAQEEPFLDLLFGAAVEPSRSPVVPSDLVIKGARAARVLFKPQFLRRLLSNAVASGMPDLERDIVFAVWTQVARKGWRKAWAAKTFKKALAASGSRLAWKPADYFSGGDELFLAASALLFRGQGPVLYTKFLCDMVKDSEVAAIHKISLVLQGARLAGALRHPDFAEHLCEGLRRCDPKAESLVLAEYWKAEIVPHRWFRGRVLRRLERAMDRTGSRIRPHVLAHKFPLLHLSTQTIVVFVLDALLGMTAMALVLAHFFYPDNLQEFFERVYSGLAEAWSHLSALFSSLSS